MSSSSTVAVDISGIDWMISYMGWKSRSLPSGGNNFSIIADVSDSFCYEELKNKLSTLMNIDLFLSGKVKRNMAAWRPLWYYEKGNAHGMICTIDRESQQIHVDNILPEGISAKIVFFEQNKQILFTFSHSVFDGVGAENFVSSLLQGDISDTVPSRKITADVQAMKKDGRELQALMKKFPEKNILRLPRVFSNEANEFTRISVPRERYGALERNVEKKYGPFSLSLYILALILCQLEKDIFPAASDREYIFIPMSVDLRNSMKEKENTFFNHWSLMPLLISRKVLAEGVSSTIPHLRTLYSEALSSRTPQLFYSASEAMKYLPFRLIDMIVKFNPAKTLGTLMFSFLNSSHCAGDIIQNLAHYPVMPYGNNLGFFVNLCNGNLNMIISRRPWNDAGAFSAFCEEIRRQLQEEMA